MTQQEKDETKKEKKAAKELARRNIKGKLGKEFRDFITRGNVVDLAIGVIMGNAFSAIVTAFTNILLSICTWGAPGGLKGLVTVLPAVNAGQAGMDPANGLGQSFAASQLQALATKEAAVSGLGSEPVVIQNEMTAIAGKYTLHGTSYYFNGCALIDWGSFLNAIITFLIIALTLFIILKVYTSVKNTRAAFEAELKAKEEDAWAKEHPEAAALKKKQEEEAAKEAAAGVVKKPDNIVLLEEIRDQVKAINAEKAAK
jgi:large-conductance mechanosensitive channel